MKKLTILALGLLFSLACSKNSETHCGISEYAKKSSQTIKVLFIGNSFTAQIPIILKKVARLAGDSLYYIASTPGGWDFKRHSKLPETLKAIKAEAWDYVVLQESGWLSALNNPYADSTIYPYADSLVNYIRKNTPGAQILFYLPHAYLYGIDGCKGDSVECSFKTMLRNMKNTHMRLSFQLNVPVAPVGIVWAVFIDRYKAINLFDLDYCHANMNGTYIDVCCFYSILFRKKPFDIYIPKAVNANNANAIQQTVTDVLFNCNPNWEEYSF